MGFSHGQGSRKGDNAAAGFTLVEMSIVLVIIGLIVGGILVGQNLIHAAALRNQIKQLQDFQVAFNTFKVKYDCIPGDCANATSFFGTTDPAGNAINNGNGNGQVDTSSGQSLNTNNILWPNSTEMWGAIQQLSMAKMLAYSPVNGTNPAFPATEMFMPSINMDTSATMYIGASYNFAHTAGNPNLTTYQTGTNILWIVGCSPPGLIGIFGGITSWDNDCAIFTATDLQAMDTKIDDGVPLSGQLFGFGGPNPGYNDCLNQSGSNYTYKTSNTTQQCQALFVLN